MIEEWRDIKGYEGHYQVSNLGRIKSLNYRQTCKEKIMELGFHNRGYLMAHLSKSGKQKNFFLHRLVAQTFIPNPYNLPQVNHKDENKSNNCVDNLEWCTAKYNQRYSRAKKVCCYKNNKLVKVYSAIRDVKKDGFKPQNVCKCCSGNRKSHHGFKWKYLPDK